MQQLVFQSAWDKQIAPNDREKIIKLFNSSKDDLHTEITFLPIKQAFNHEHALLVTVLIHNFTDIDFPIENLQLSYYETNHPVAEHSFSFPGLTVTANTSMPWTFIFPHSSWLSEPLLQDGELIIIN
ncbi:SLAP domain-containing protein [Oceanobacillus luteolus]|uniref:SLAP domain-containing protein n=1 Tax=Oceanobacillus luteolus TaxID=1274358 RepID=A0ABW4HM03_9BACI|nr:SLAP domain-containing protein [Oceanobacillus luteolus]MCM3739490.1 SLAP domain-containing protein [Oceanobacillus luteolus]